MRIAIVSSEYGVGGVGTYTLHQAEQLSNKHDVLIFCAPKLCDYAPIDGVKVVEVPLNRSVLGNSDIQKLAWSLDVRKRIQSENDTRGIDVINPHLSPAYFYPLFMNDIPSVLTLHTTHLMSQTHPTKWYRQLVGRGIDKIACERSQKVIVLNNAFKFDIEHKLSSPKVVQIPNGVDVSAYADESSEDAISEFESTYGIDTSDKQVLFLSRLEPVKRPMAMVDAANTVPDDVSILIAGGGSLEQDIREAASGLENVTVMGRIPEEHKHVAYQTSDLFVLPSMREGMPTVVLEALAAGVPVLATDIPGSRDVVNRNVGWLTHPDLSGFEQNLYDALTDDEALARKSVNAQEEAKQYDWKQVASRIEETLQSVR